ncbi:OmpA family protein [Erythrobacter arachoides]|uniref:OmpA family protein n=1 Tax=Aurantiacibacter arachoides TaxID=1850444 RepID=A0A844ZYP2_9SPHN|nr:OmpA family protein [Aurantiacibacter arachoides]MXO92828.1 OmpA family protein [Aurantiacibacter arachoides]GGD54179.1 hypothetical protein GCM10011411_12600 [Aurantiacibacter arachoides]
MTSSPNHAGRFAAGMTALAVIAAASAPAAAQNMDDRYATANDITVTADVPSDLSGMVDGPEVEGMIAARNGSTLRITNADGTTTDVRLSEATEVRSRGGFLGLARSERAANTLLNGLPVRVDTVQWGSSLIASRVVYDNSDQQIAAMIANGTAQGFAEQTAATEALRGRVANIDQYNIHGTTNVYFDTGRHGLDTSDEVNLCQAAAQAQATDNALLLVVGYTDDVGDQEFNQELSERRATRVVNYLQQECGWEPWRMLTPTGMAEADPTADNTTEAGRAQNRRVAVNILVSKAVDGI